MIATLNVGGCWSPCEVWHRPQMSRRPQGLRVGLSLSTTGFLVISCSRRTIVS
jgi:hypothetical protein